ncbi:copper resistance protein CopC [Iamia majanohamensis]|uniref:Copper resistance protein CopC n=1 Tax=Iamia majanohamensis TaxID=467976 RepID=A0AAE9YGH3_9ACTN|nr:copper resistance protein CopC [Iamia majanohamensis]WCO67361.1 copper resistance protein CopC [Iamia majanohamensis]
MDGPRPHRTRAPARTAAVALALLVALVVAGPARPAAAHATLQDTSPAGDVRVEEVPAEVTLTFDEPVTATTGSVQVIDPSGGRVDGGTESRAGGRTVAVAVDGDAVGTYTVAFRVVSDDGHTITGSFVFDVQTSTGAADVDQSIPLLTSAVGGVGRWLSYAGPIVAVGAALLLVVVRRGAGVGGAGRLLGRLVAGGAVAGALGAALAVLAQVALTTGRPVTGAVGLVAEVAADSRPVGVALVRAGVLALGALVALLALVSRRREAGLVAAGAVVAAGGLLAPVAGHPWTADGRALAVTADGAHLLAASVWLGLLAALAAAAARLPDPVAAVRAVSRAALVTSLVLLVTGTASAWLLLGSVEALLRTASGQLVIAKVVGFGVLVSLGWVNRSRLVPLLGRAVGVQGASTERAPALVAAGGGSPSLPDDGGPGEDDEGAAEPGPVPTGRGALARLLQVVRVELVVGALVLVATAALVNQPPGRDVLEQPFTTTQTVDGATMLFEVEPARAGTNAMHLYVTDETGNPAPVDALEVAVGREGVPERKLPVEQISPDHAVVYGASFPTPGTWAVDVTTVRVGVPRQFRFEVPIR